MALPARSVSSAPLERSAFRKCCISRQDAATIQEIAQAVHSAGSFKSASRSSEDISSESCFSARELTIIRPFDSQREHNLHDASLKRLFLSGIFYSFDYFQEEKAIEFLLRDHPYFEKKGGEILVKQDALDFWTLQHASHHGWITVDESDQTHLTESAWRANLSQYTDKNIPTFHHFVSCLRILQNRYKRLDKLAKSRPHPKRFFESEAFQSIAEKCCHRLAKRGGNRAVAKILCYLEKTTIEGKTRFAFPEDANAYGKIQNWLNRWKRNDVGCEGFFLDRRPPEAFITESYVGKINRYYLSQIRGILIPQDVTSALHRLPLDALYDKAARLLEGRLFQTPHVRALPLEVFTRLGRTASYHSDWLFSVGVDDVDPGELEQLREWQRTIGFPAPGPLTCDVSGNAHKLYKQKHYVTRCDLYRVYECNAENSVAEHNPCPERSLAYFETLSAKTSFFEKTSASEKVFFACTSRLFLSPFAYRLPVEHELDLYLLNYDHRSLVTKQPTNPIFCLIGIHPGEQPMVTMCLNSLEFPTVFTKLRHALHLEAQGDMRASGHFEEVLCDVPACDDTGSVSLYLTEALPPMPEVFFHGQNLCIQVSSTDTVEIFRMV